MGPTQALAGQSPDVLHSSFNMHTHTHATALTMQTLACVLLQVGPTQALAGQSPDALALPPAPGARRLAGPYW